MKPCNTGLAQGRKAVMRKLYHFNIITTCSQTLQIFICANNTDPGHIFSVDFSAQSNLA